MGDAGQRDSASEAASRGRKRYGRGPTKVGEGRYQTKVQLPSGKRVSVYGKTKSECRKKANALRRDAEAGLPIVPPSQTLCQYLTGHPHWPAKDPSTGERLPAGGWLGLVAKASVRLTTFHRYEQNLRLYILPELGTKRLANLEADDLDRLYSRLGEDVERGGLALAARTVHQVHMVLHNALAAGVKKRQLRYNVADGATPPRLEKAEVRVLTPSEACMLLEKVVGNRLEGIVTLAVTTGMRLGELVGLRWEDVDLGDRVLHVKRQIRRVRGEGLTESPPKSRASRRPILLTEIAVSALRGQRQRNREMEVLAGIRWDDRGLVFPNSLGRPWEPRRVEQLLETFLARHGLPEVTPHGLRHSAATLLLALKVPAKVVQEMLGHTTITLTSDTYQDHVASLHHEAVAALDALLRPPGHEVSSDLSSGPGAGRLRLIREEKGAAPG